MQLAERESYSFETLSDTLHGFGIRFKTALLLEGLSESCKVAVWSVTVFVTFFADVDLYQVSGM